MIGAPARRGSDTVHQTVVSVGPYRFSMVRSGAQRATSSGGQASPATASTRRSSSPCGSAAASAAGVMQAWVTRFARRKSDSSTPPSSPAGATTIVDALPKAIIISNTEASKLGDANCSDREPGTSCMCARCSATRFASPRWVTTTPLGRPVDPEV
ncbi:hypothetical protein GCM10009855_08260 [Gordonia cholesterolivorans]|uniref:Uncharacterized protein n=1 Tax=Gordonia cholesterolivorans TaxID=559625 RepID=A0ABN3H7L2_9ACTN